MVSVIKAKVRVHEVKKVVGGEGFTANPVYSTDPDDPNKTYSDSTPSGKVELFITNKNVFGFFEPGEEYLVTFEKAVVPEPVPAPQASAPAAQSGQ